MKKEISKASIYLVLALVSGVFYREFTKFMHFDGLTTLRLTHLHLFVLGTLLFLILALFVLNTDLASNQAYKKFNIIYNIALPFMVIMFYVRGILQVLAYDLSNAMNAAISGMAGISHILMAIALYFLFKALSSVEVRK